MSGTMNQAPVARDDVINIRPYYSGIATGSHLDYSQLLGNDSDPDGGALTLVAIEAVPGTGTGQDWAQLSDPDTYALYFNVDYDIHGEGVATFRYTVADEQGLTSTAILRILYGRPDAAPETFTLDEDTRILLASRDVGSPGNGGSTGYDQPANGRIESEQVYVDGSWKWQTYYRPDPDFNGTDTFNFIVYSIDDNPFYRPIILNVTPVADAPEAGDDAATTTAGTAVTLSLAQLLANDTDADGDALAVTAVGGATNGSVVLGAGGVTFTPAAGFVGQAGFTYTVGDGTGLADTATVTVTVAPATPPGGYARGTAGADLLDYSGAAARVQIAGLGGNDTLRGGAGNDAINGGAGNDVISGGAGNDVITGGTGADRMAGGAGADTFLIARGDLGATNATDLIVDFQGAGAAGGDAIRFTGFGAGATLGLVGSVGNALAYEVQGADGTALGRLLVASGGVALGAGDYVFA